MPTNIDRAAEVIDAELAKDPEVYDALFGDEHVAISHKLRDADLLTPDPVPPSGSEDRSPWWFYLGDQIVGTSGYGDVGIQHTVVIDDEDGSPVHSERWIDLTPEDARHLAAILLTAATHATQEKK